MFVRRTTLVVRRPRAFPPLLRRTVWAWSSDALVLPANQLSQRPSLRGVATAATITTTAAGVDVVGTGSAVKRASGADTPTRGSGIGPINQYDAWVAEGRLHDDAYQRGIVKHLQRVHDDLENYSSPTVVHPTYESLAPQSLFASLFGREPPSPLKTQVPDNLPKGMYLYGDVGSGKTMLMDMFYNTLPAHITSKTRIHFHHFMQDVHRRLHKVKMSYGADFDAIPFVGAEIAQVASVLCFDEFQCTDVADAMILRRLLKMLMGHGVVMVVTSNRHPNELYMNGIQRQSFLPCIALLKTALTVINLDSSTDYRKIPRPHSGVYFHGSSAEASKHAHKWFEYLGNPNGSVGPRLHSIWGRKINVPEASGFAAKFSFNDICGGPTSAADYLELCKHYRAFVVTDVPRMDYKTRDLARRFITFVDAVYESKAKLVLTTLVPFDELFMSAEDVKSSIDDTDGGELEASMRSLIDDLGMDMKMLKNSSIFTGDEERFAFARALSRLAEMSSVQWVEAA